MRDKKGKGDGFNDDQLVAGKRSHKYSIDDDDQDLDVNS